jgi:hypothetical protein
VNEISLTDHSTQDRLRVNIPLVRSKGVEFDSFGHILAHSSALRVAHTKVILGSSKVLVRSKVNNSTALAAF